MCLLVSVPLQTTSSRQAETPPQIPLIYEALYRDYFVRCFCTTRQTRTKSTSCFLAKSKSKVKVFFDPFETFSRTVWFLHGAKRTPGSGQSWTSLGAFHTMAIHWVTDESVGMKLQQQHGLKWKARETRNLWEFTRLQKIQQLYKSTKPQRATIETMLQNHLTPAIKAYTKPPRYRQKIHKHQRTAIKTHQTRKQGDSWKQRNIRKGKRKTSVHAACQNDQHPKTSSMTNDVSVSSVTSPDASARPVADWGTVPFEGIEGTVGGGSEGREGLLSEVGWLVGWGFEGLRPHKTNTSFVEERR